MALKWFWFSQKQYEQGLRFDAGHHCFVTVDGKEHEYTECSSEDTPGGKWDDYRLIASGADLPVRVVGGIKWKEMSWRY